MATESLVFDILARDGASPSFAKVGAAAKVASGELKDLSDKLKAVDGKSAQARVGLKGDKEAGIALDRLDAKLITLGKRVSNPNIKLEGVLRARAEIDSLDLALDRLGAKTARPGIGGFLSSLGGGGGIPGGLGLTGPVGIGAGIGIASLVPGLVGLLAGGGIGALGAGGAFAIGSAQQQRILALQKKAQTATGGAFQTDISQIIGIRRRYAPELQVATAGRGLEQSALGTFAQAIGGGGTRSFASGLASVMTQLGTFIKTLGPQLGEMFRASLPFLKSFVTVLEHAAVTVLPALTQILNEMVRSGALKLMTEGFIALTDGLTAFIKNLGPGIRPSADIFKHVAREIGDVLGFLGKVFAIIAQVMDFNFPQAAKKGANAVIASMRAFFHDIAAIFDAVRHFIAASWDATWNDTKKIVTSGISAVVGFFKGMTSRVLGALFGLGHTLYGFARAALNEMWSGFKSIAGSIISWVGNFASGIWHKVKSFFGISSPSSVFYEIGKNLMLGLFHGIKDHAHKAVNAVTGAIGGIPPSGARTGSVAVEQRYAASLLGSFGWPGGELGPLIALWNRESGWNPYAVNPSSGAYGIPQSLGHGHPYNLGDYKAQIIWGLQYIAGRYGSPSAAWSHEMASGWYDRGGWLPTGASIAINNTGRPEMVVPGGGFGGMTVVIQVDPAVAASTPDARLGQHIAQHVTAALKRGMALYPAGVSPR